MDIAIDFPIFLLAFRRQIANRKYVYERNFFLHQEKQLVMQQNCYDAFTKLLTETITQFAYLAPCSLSLIINKCFALTIIFSFINDLSNTGYHTIVALLPRVKITTYSIRFTAN